MDIKKQIAINTFGAFWIMFVQWVISVALVRMGGFADAGIFSLAMSIANVFGAISNYGIRGYQISDAGNLFSQRQYLWARVFTVLASFVLCGAYFVIDTDYTPVSRWCIFIYLIYINSNFLSDVMFGTLQLKDKLYMNGYSNITKGCCCLVSFLLVYWVSKNLMLAMMCMAVGNIAVILCYDIRRYYAEEKGAFRFITEDVGAVRQIVALCLPIMISSLLPLVVTATPRRTIESFWGEEALGVFSSLFTPTVVITTLVPTVIQGIVPGIAAVWKNRDEKAFLHRVLSCFTGILAFTLFAMLCALIAGRPVMKLLFGEEILPYFNILYLAIFVSGLSAINGCGGTILVCMRYTKTVTVVALVELIITLALTRAVVLNRGIAGAALTLLAAYGASVVIEFSVIAWAGRHHFRVSDT